MNMGKLQDAVKGSTNEMFGSLCGADSDKVAKVLREECDLSAEIADPCLNGIADRIYEDVRKARERALGRPLTPQDKMEEEDAHLIGALTTAAVSGFVVGALAQKGNGRAHTIVGMIEDAGHVFVEALRTERAHGSHRSHGSPGGE